MQSVVKSRVDPIDHSLSESDFDLPGSIQVIDISDSKNLLKIENENNGKVLLKPLYAGIINSWLLYIAQDEFTWVLSEPCKLSCFIVCGSGTITCWNDLEDDKCVFELKMKSSVIIKNKNLMLTKDKSSPFLKLIITEMNDDEA